MDSIRLVPNSMFLLMLVRSGIGFKQQCAESGNSGSCFAAIFSEGDMGKMGIVRGCAGSTIAQSDAGASVLRLQLSAQKVELCWSPEIGYWDVILQAMNTVAAADKAKWDQWQAQQTQEQTQGNDGNTGKSNGGGATQASRFNSTVTNPPPADNSTLNVTRSPISSVQRISLSPSVAVLTICKH